MSDIKSTELHELFKAMALAQSEISVAEKNAVNPHYKNEYANLKAVIEASRPALCKNGLSVMQQIIHDGGTDFLITMLCHTSGQWISSRARLMPVKNDAQALGSYLTYMRRYSYSALIGVYDGFEDDDAESAVAIPVQEQKKIDPNKITTEQHKIIYNVDHEIRDIILSSYKVKSVSDLTKEQADAIIKTYIQPIKG